MSDETKVSVEEMVAALNDVINYVPHRDSTITLMAARAYILAAQSEIAEMRIELQCERAVIKQMRQMAYDARAAANKAIFGIEALAQSDQNRVVETGGDNA